MSGVGNRGVGSLWLPAGQATNVVTDYVKVQGESRSQDTKFISVITAAYRQAFPS